MDACLAAWSADWWAICLAADLDVTMAAVKADLSAREMVELMGLPMARMTVELTDKHSVEQRVAQWEQSSADLLV